VRAAGKVVIIQEVALEKPVTYPITVLKGSPIPDLAQAFVDFVTGSQGASLLEARGFRRP
jgi:molybdate transport system substrate-binding protein